MSPEVLKGQNECGFVIHWMQKLREIRTQCLGCLNKEEGRIMKFKVQHEGTGKSDLGKEMNSM